MDVSEVAKLYTAPGPYVSLYLNTPLAVENAAARREAAWRAARQELARQGADDATLDALGQAVLDDAMDGESVVAFASHGDVLYCRRLPVELARESATFAPVPYVTPLLAWRQTRLPYVVVHADRTGAEILAYTDATDPIVAREVQGSHDVIRKPHPGGWSQMRYQHRAEDSWEGNAREVADVVDRVVRSVDAAAVLVGGDVRAVQLLCDHVAEATKPLIQTLEHAGGPLEEGEIADRVAAVARERIEGVIAEFEEERGQRDRAADGVAATVDALRLAQVATLLVRDDPNDGRRLWFGSDSALAGLARRDVADAGADRVQEGRLTDVLVRAALSTGADVLVTDVANEGCGAILRYRL